MGAKQVIREYGINCMIALVALIAVMALINLEPSITGFVTAENVTNETEANQTSSSITESAAAETTSSTANTTTPIANETSLSNNTAANATSDSAANATSTNETGTSPITINESAPQAAEPIARNVDIKLEYKTNTVYDEDNNGEEPIGSAIDFTVENTGFNWAVDEAKLCTKWQVYSIENETLTIACHGSNDCCGLIDLVPKRELWKDPLFLTFGDFGAGYENIVNAQVIYADYNISREELKADIVNSKSSNLSAKFFVSDIIFRDVCVETCSLTGFNDTSYKLIFEIENAVLNLEELAYSLVEIISHVRVDFDVVDNRGVDFGSYKVFKNDTLVKEEFVEPDYYDIEVVPEKNVIEKIVIENVNFTKPITASIGIDNVSKEILIDKVDVKKRYAINLEDLEFEKAILTANATGNTLYKCRAWDYSTEVCFGTWEKVKSLVKGQAYNLTLSADDPGFIEGDINITEIEAPAVNITTLAFIKNISNVSVSANRNATINLSAHFINLDNNTVFDYYKQDNVTILFEQNTAIIIPDAGFTGIRYTFITANQSGNVAVSNVFAVNVEYAIEEITPEIISGKKDFKFGEDSVFEFEFIKKEELVRKGRWKEEYEVFEEKTDRTKEELRQLSLKIVKKEKQKKKWVTENESIEAKVLDFSGGETAIEPEIEELREGKFDIRLKKPRAFKAGRYKINLELVKDGVTYTQEQDFTWGVLAINLNKSIYLPNEDAFISIGVLDDAGKIVCNADVVLEITDPLNQKTTLTTANNDILISPECTYLGVTQLPDYYSSYRVNGIGTYAMNLTAITLNGVRSIQDNFSVQSSVDFDVARKSATRVYPFVPYAMNISVIANKDYNGIINEYVPLSFSITPQDGLTITAINDTKILSWNVNLKKDNKIELSYQYDAPDISPEFYLLGPLDIGTFKESRQWQIANDASFPEFDGLIVYGEGTVTTPRYRNWTGSDFTAESSAPDLGASSTIQFVIVKSSTKRNSTAVGILDAQGDILLTVRNNTNGTFNPWLDVASIGTTNDGYRGFDIDVEDATGDFIAVYEKNTAADRTLYYRTSNGTDWSGERTITLHANVTAQAQLYVAMENQNGSNEIMMASAGTSDDITAARWDGDAWVNITNITTNAAAVDEERFGIAWESNTGNAMIVWGEGTTNVNYNIWHRKNTSWWADRKLLVNRGAVVQQVDICADPLSNYIVAVMGPDSLNDLLVQAWNGTAWLTANQPTEESGVENRASKNAVCKWTKNNSVALIVFIDSNALGFDFLTYNATDNTWKCPATGATVTALTTTCNTGSVMSGDIEVVAVRRDPNSNDIMVMGMDLLEDLEMFKFNGATFTQPTTALLETTTTTISGAIEPGDFDYNRLVTVPAPEVDTTKPRLNASIDDSSPGRNQIINLTANVSDETGLSWCQFIENGSLANGAKTYFNKTVTGTNDQCSQNYTIALAAGNVINFTVVVNDTNNNKNESEFASGVIGQIVTVGAQTKVDKCRNLNLDNITYHMTKDVNASGTCMYVLANNITLDCHGYEINYSQSVVGYGINISSYNFTIIRSCNIVQADISTDNSNSYGIYVFRQSNNNSIYNNTIITAGTNSHGAYLTSTVYNNSIYENKINTTSISSYGIYLQSTAQFNRVFDNVVVSADNGIYLDSSASNNSVFLNNVTANDGFGIDIISSSSGNHLYRNIVLSKGTISTYGVRIQSGSNNYVYDNNITVTAQNSIGSASGIEIRATSSNNIVFSNTVITTNTSSPGIFLEGNPTGTIFYNNSITTTNATDSFGIELRQNIQDTRFYGNTITSKSGGVLINGSGNPTAIRNINFTNDTIVPCNSGCSDNYFDVVLTANATDITFLNVSLNKSRISIEDFSNDINNLTVKWYLAINVTNSTNNNPIANVEVNINNSNAVNLFSGLTDATGGIATQIITEFTMNGSTNSSQIFTSDSCVGISNVNVTCFSPFNISVNHSDYVRTNLSLSINKSIFANISLSIITAAAPNTAPTMAFDSATSSTLAGTDPTEAGTTLVWFVFNVTDADGEDDIDETGTRFNLTLGPPGGSGGAQWRYNNTCTNVSKIPADNKVVFNCSVYLYWLDNSSANWVLNATGKDVSSATTTNDSERFTYNELSAMSFAVAYINFSNVNLGANDQAAGSPLILNNTGNDDFDEINITAMDMFGVTTTNEFVGVSNFTVNFTNANAGLGTRLTRTPQKLIRDDDISSNLTLPHGHTRALTDYNDNIISTKGNQSLYFWVDVPATGLSAQKYNATWNVTVVDKP